MTRKSNVNSSPDSEFAASSMAELLRENDQLLERTVLQFSGNILGLVLGVLCGLIVFFATNWLVIKGGDVVGPHLGLLGQYFIGYSVSFVGSVVGTVYGFVVGYFSGLFIAWIYNGVVAMTIRRQQ